jgi:NAD(P)H dehydrogenase (quinone)
VNVLIIYAHPEPKSFNGAMRDVAVAALEGAGHAVTLSDLYAMRFNAVVGAEDFRGERSNPDFLSVATEQTKAFQDGALAPDIVAEQEKLRRADFVIFQFPVWWFGMPAIMKGWADRVFARGFAYLPGHKYDTGMFRGKTAMVAATTGTSADTYAPDGIDGDILNVLWPLHNGLLRYSGYLPSRRPATRSGDRKRRAEPDLLAIFAHARDAMQNLRRRLNTAKRVVSRRHRRNRNLREALLPNARRSLCDSDVAQPRFGATRRARRQPRALRNSGIA